MSSLCFARRIQASPNARAASFILRTRICSTPRCQISQGALGELARKLAAKSINITSGYATTVKASKKASVVLGVPDLDEAARLR
jgi:hypothetical protein